MTVLNSTLNNLPGRSDGWIVPGDPASAAIALPVDVPSATLNIADRLSIAGTLDTEASAPGRQVWRWRLTAAQVTTALGTPAETVMVPWRATTGVGDDLSPLAAGELRVVSKWTAGHQQMFGSVLVLIGPPGASTVEAAESAATALLAQAAAEDARDEAQQIAQGATVDGAVAALVDDPDSATRLALSSTYVVTAGAPGSHPSGDSAMLQALADAIPAAGGVIHLRPGTYELTSLVTFANPTTLTGGGGGFIADAATTPGSAITTIEQPSATVGALLFTAPGSNVRDLAVVNTSTATPTAGAGIEFTHGYQCNLTRVTVALFYDNLVFEGWYSMLDSCWIYDPVRYGIRFHATRATLYDHLDAGIVNSVISMVSTARTPDAAIRWEGGGGLRLVGNKINGRGQPGTGAGTPIGTIGSFAYGLDVYFTVPSIDLNMTANSVANTRSALVRVTSDSASGSIATGAIVGNLFNSVVSGVGIEVGSSGTTDRIRGITISENSFQWMTGATTGIKVYCSRGVHVGTNTWGPGLPTGTLIDIASTPDSGQQTLGLTVAPQDTAQVDALDIVTDARTFGSSTNLFDGAVDYDYTKQVAIAASATPVTLFSFDLNSNGARGHGVLVDFELVGQNSNAGHSSSNNKGVAIRQSRSVETNNTGTVTVTTVGADIAGGTGAAFMVVTYTATSNRVTVTVQTSDATQVAFWGQARIKVRGKLARFHKGA